MVKAYHYALKVVRITSGLTVCKLQNIIFNSIFPLQY